MNLTQITCPYCHSEMIKTIKSYETKHNGTPHLHKCKQCNKVFSETKGSFLEKLVKPISLITKVLQSRHEDMGVNAVQRRKHSAYRRKTNTYAKNKDALQRVLDCEWIVHNFINEHATTKQIPAVSLGIMERGLSWEDVFKIQRAA